MIALTTYADDASVLGALRAGARGYLTKDASAEQIAAAIRASPAARRASTRRSRPRSSKRSPPPSAAAAGPRRRAARRPDRARGRGPRPDRDGLSNAEIAERLVVSQATVKSHVNHLFAKIGARDRAQAVGYAYRHGMVEAE